MTSNPGKAAENALPPVTQRAYQPGDEEAILATFNLVFSAENPHFVPRTMAQWRWVNSENPSGLRVCVSVAEDGRIAAHVAGIAQRVVYRGEPGHVNQSVDGFSHPDWRGVLKRPGVYADTLNFFNRTYAGPPPDGDTIVWGYPVLAAWRIAQAHCQQKYIRTQNKLVLDPDKLVRPAAPGIDVEEVGAVPEDVEQLFERASKPHGLIAVRDVAQLQWRFFDNPFHTYRVATARARGKLVGYAVYREGLFDDDRDGLVCDWLADPDSPDGAHALRVWLAECARADGQRLTAIFPDWIEEWIEFQRMGFHVHGTKYFPGAYLYGKRLSVRWLHRHWYYTLGDSDLC